MTDAILGLFILLFVVTLFVGFLVFFFGSFIGIAIAIFTSTKKKVQAYADRKPDLPIVSLAQASLETPLAFQYDMAGGRLRGIGPVGIRYDASQSYVTLRPAWLGDLKLEYKRGLLARIGSLEIKYRRFFYQPIQLGHAPLDTDRFGNRIIAVGDIPIQYESARSPLLMGGRPKFIGDVEIVYNKFSFHPLYNYYVGGFPEVAIGRYGNSVLSEWMFIVIFFVLHDYAVKVYMAKHKRPGC